MYKTIIVITPTEDEASRFPNELPEGVSLAVGGVGMAEIAAAVVRESIHKPDLLILAGIAGAYPQSGLSAGDTVVVSSETISDLGAMRDGNFIPLYTKEYTCPLAAVIKSLPKATGYTVNTGSFGKSPSSKSKDEKAIENMEGAAFFAVSDALGIPFLEIRAVSNITNDRRDDWRIDMAIQSLAEGVLKVINELRKE